MDPYLPQNVGTIHVTDGNQGIPSSGRVPPHVSYLRDLLAKERANLCTEYNWRIQLSQEVEDLKQELSRQKKLKEMFIDRMEEKKQELERLQQSSNAETLSTAIFASMVNNTIKTRNKKVLQMDYEKLQMAHKIYQEKHDNELQGGKNEIKLLQEELMKLKASYNEVCQSHATNQEKFNTELQEEKTENNALQERLMKFSASNHEACQSHATNQEKVNTELQEEENNNNALQEKLMKLSASNHEDSPSHGTNQEKFDTELQEDNKKNAFQEKLMKLSASNHEDSPSHGTNHEEFNTEQQEKKKELDSLKEELKKIRACYHELCQSEVNGKGEDDVPKEESLSGVPKKPKKTSLWTRICRFFWKRKPQ